MPKKCHAWLYFCQTIIFPKLLACFFFCRKTLTFIINFKHIWHVHSTNEVLKYQICSSENLFRKYMYVNGSSSKSFVLASTEAFTKLYMQLWFDSFVWIHHKLSKIILAHFIWDKNILFCMGNRRIAINWKISSLSLLFYALLKYVFI